jgi:hypothetical protein
MRAMIEQLDRSESKRSLGQRCNLPGRAWDPDLVSGQESM